MYKLYNVLIISLFLFTEICLGQWFVQNPKPERGPLNNVYYLDANYGIIVGMSGTILKTTNGGNEWFSQPSNTPTDLYAQQLCYLRLCTNV